MDVDTLLMEQNKTQCQQKEIIGIQTIKASDEVGLEDQEFVHVIRSVIQQTNLPVIVKIHHASNLFVQRELQALSHLQTFENSVHKICDFTCMDDKGRWEHPVSTEVSFCNHKKDLLHFIVLEYIENGDLALFFESNPSLPMIASVVLQVQLAIFTLGFTYKILHGDLNSGNMLLSTTDKTRIHYRLLDKEYRIPSFGKIPVFIDYGRCRFHPTVAEVPREYVMDDVYIALSVLSVYFVSSALKTRFREFILLQSQTNQCDPHRLIKDTKEFFSLWSKRVEPLCGSKRLLDTFPSLGPSGRSGNV